MVLPSAINGDEEASVSFVKMLLPRYVLFGLLVLAFGVALTAIFKVVVA